MTLLLALLLQHPGLGEAHPDFLLPDLDGGTGRLSDWRGKKVLIFNFASW